MFSGMGDLKKSKPLIGGWEQRGRKTEFLLTSASKLSTEPVDYKD